MITVPCFLVIIIHLFQKSKRLPKKNNKKRISSGIIKKHVRNFVLEKTHDAISYKLFSLSLELFPLFSGLNFPIICRSHNND
jgi:hypothetical protein